MENANSSFWQRQALTIKGAVIFFLMLVLLIPTSMVSELIREREGRQAEAVAEVSGKWGGQQTLSGPVLVVPYERPVFSEKGEEKSRSTGYAYFLPSELKINGKLDPEKRHRGIFEVVLYKGALTMEGQFDHPRAEGVIPDDATVFWGKARLELGIPDLRGLKEQVSLQWNEQNTVFDPGMPMPGVAGSGINAPVVLGESATYTFKVALNIKGSGSLFFTPLGKLTSVNLSSSWTDPSFTGAFLPEEKTVDAQGFTANWKVLHLNRNFPQSWNSEQQVSFSESAFGVDLLLPVDNYQKSTRSVKYAILFIGLSFLTVFFIEMRQARPVHPFQYALIGLAVVIFYTLLVSISEQLSFNAAYFIAAGMTLLLAGWYAGTLFQSGKMGFLVGGTLAALYGFLFVTLQLQDYALLIGSLGLFAILAIVMYVSRKIKWDSEKNTEA